MCQRPPEAGKPWYLVAQLKELAYGVTDHGSDAAVKLALQELMLVLRREQGQQDPRDSRDRQQWRKNSGFR